MNTTIYTTLSGFCLQCLITDLVFSQPPSIISYIGSTSVGAGVRDTWQLWGPRNSNVREPARTGPNLYSKLSGVLNSAPSDNKGYNFILLGTFYVMSTVLEITWTFSPSIFQEPVAPQPVHTPTKAIGNGSGSAQEMKGMASPSRPADMMPPSQRTQKPRNSPPFKMLGVSISTLSGLVLFLLITLFVLPQPPRKIWQ